MYEVLFTVRFNVVTCMVAMCIVLNVVSAYSLVADFAAKINAGKIALHTVPARMPTASTKWMGKNYQINNMKMYVPSSSYSSYIRGTDKTASWFGYYYRSPGKLHIFPILSALHDAFFLIGLVTDLCETILWTRWQHALPAQVRMSIKEVNIKKINSIYRQRNRYTWGGEQQPNVSI